MRLNDEKKNGRDGAGFCVLRWVDWGVEGFHTQLGGNLSLAMVELIFASLCRICTDRSSL